MGGFRSQPDLEKHTISKESLGLTYAITSMCGNSSLMKDGDSTWRMLIWEFFYPTEKRISLQSSTAMEVNHS
jgi:hypothetical protein